MADRNDAAGCLAVAVIVVVLLLIAVAQIVVAVVKALVIVAIVLGGCALALYLLSIPISLAIQAWHAQDTFDDDMLEIEILADKAHDDKRLLEQRRMEGERLKRHDAVVNRDSALIDKSFERLTAYTRHSESELERKAIQALVRVKRDGLVVKRAKQSKIGKIETHGHETVGEELDRIYAMEKFLGARESELRNICPVEERKAEKAVKELKQMPPFFCDVRFSQLLNDADMELLPTDERMLSFAQSAVLIGVIEAALLFVVGIGATVFVAIEQFSRGFGKGMTIVFVGVVLICIGFLVIAYFVTKTAGIEKSEMLLLLDQAIRGR